MPRLVHLIEICGKSASLAIVVLPWLASTCLLVVADDRAKQSINSRCEFLDLEKRPDHLENTGLTTQWAQELVGADLAKNEVLADPVLVRALKPVPVAVLDSEFHTQGADGGPGHAQKVLGIIEATSPTSPSLMVSVVAKGEISLHRLNALAFQNMRTNQPRLINISQTFTSISPSPRGLLNLPGKPLIIMASGNSYPERLYLGALDNTHASARPIQVSNLNRWGWVQHTSQFHEDVVIAAPADNLSSSFVNDSYVRFGGTSSAAPLVTSALANFESISGIQLSRDEAIAVLQGSSFSLPALEDPKFRNGAGMLNIYKLTQVALRLRRASVSTSDSFAESPARIKLFTSPELYEFSPSTLNIELEEAELGSRDCARVKASLATLRKELLLASRHDPRREIISNILAKFYRTNGLYDLAGFFEDLERSQFQRHVLSVFKTGTSYQRLQAIRNCGLAGINCAPIVRKALSSTDDHEKTQAVGAAILYAFSASENQLRKYMQQLTGLGLDPIIHAAAASSHQAKILSWIPDIGWRPARIEAIGKCWMLEGGTRLFEQTLNNSKNSTEYEKLIASVGRFSPALDIYLDLALAKGTPKLKLAVMQSTLPMDWNRKKKYLEIGITDSDANVRSTAARSLIVGGADALPLIKRGLADRSGEVRHNARLARDAVPIIDPQIDPQIPPDLDQEHGTEEDTTQRALSPAVEQALKKNLNY